MAGRQPAYRVGVDIGGTFTDLVMVGDEGDGGRVFVKKVSSTPDDYARGIIDGLSAALAEWGIAADAIGEVVHGTTVASNTILEFKGARTGLITTKGFRDVLEIRRLRMPALYDMAWEKPPPLVERYLRTEVDERLNWRGEVVRPLDEGSLTAAVDHLLREGVEIIAVCLINSYANPTHEQLIRDYLTRNAPGVGLCLSSEILPEIKEYERTSTTVVNAYITPVMRRYLDRLGAGLGAIGVRAPLLVMGSSGGIMGAEAAVARPMLMVESGPAAGVVGAQALARRLALSDVITFDMGGTTAKAGIIEGGEVGRAAEYEVGGGIMIGSRLLKGGGYLLRAPAIDLAEVGAGGGSLLWLDAGGALRIGPQSAGAMPGPACYGLGGTEPTITDANVILGYLNPVGLAGGATRLHADLSHAALAARIATPLGLPIAEAAYGAHLIAVSNMIRAIKAVSSERGRDPRDYVLCAFGGNGPVFAAAMARALEMREVLIPPLPGVFSAVGLLASAVEHHLSRSFLRPIREARVEEVGTAYAALETEAVAQLAAEGYAPDRVALVRSADLRYHGQSFELTVPVPRGPLAEPDLAAIEEAFGREHERTYGHRASDDEPAELVSLRLVARGLTDGPRLPERLGGNGETQTDRQEQHSRRAYFGQEIGWYDTPVVGRDAIGPAPQPGPIIVEEYDATTVVPPDATIRRDALGNLRLALG
ncbi:MAG TPA: hydantoinase/oxoprolinase family protein [Thermomicrobiales bacterium]|jgi:N-methylhydantoinase A